MVVLALFAPCSEAVAKGHTHVLLSWSDHETSWCSDQISSFQELEWIDVQTNAWGREEVVNLHDDGNICRIVVPLSRLVATAPLSV